MKRLFLSLSLASFGAFGLVSCAFLDQGSGGIPVHNPTVDEMAQLEKKWGVPQSPSRSHRSPSSGGYEAAPAPGGAAPAPEPAPLPPGAAEPSTLSKVDPVSPGQIQQLKN